MKLYIVAINFPYEGMSDPGAVYSSREKAEAAIALKVALDSSRGFGCYNYEIFELTLDPETLDA